MRENGGTVAFASGLDGVVAVRTRLSEVDGQAGRLTIAGFPVEELAGRATFEEVLHLLWFGALPDRGELDALKAALARRRGLPEPTLELLRSAADERVPVMDALRMAAGTFDLASDDAAGLEDLGTPEGLLPGDLGSALSAVARFPTVVAAYLRLLDGGEPVEPDPDLGHAANYLYMLSGDAPTAVRERALETYLNAASDHGMNASTFAARIIISTRSDLVSAVAGAVGALKGPLHGGAPGPALDVVFEIGVSDRAEGVLRDKLGRGERLMGFGHRVYRVRDPRADVLAAAAEILYDKDADRERYALALEVEKTALRLLAEHRPGRNLSTNVEFYTALLLHGLELPTELFAPTFAVGRVAGWTAHCFEQRAQDRLIRPQSEYTGPEGLGWVPLEER